jgi:murein DD-endopeptidase MepM/ murein hydrolase activator NlpD
VRHPFISTPPTRVRVARALRFAAALWLTVGVFGCIAAQQHQPPPMITASPASAGVEPSLLASAGDQVSPTPDDDPSPRPIYRGAPGAPRPAGVPIIFDTPLEEFLITAALTNSFQPMEIMLHPFPTGEISSGWGEPRSHGRVHLAADIRELRGDMGVGKPIRAMTRGKITRLGTPDIDSGRYGRKDCRPGYVVRSGHRFKRVIEVEGYGTVCPFTSTLGSSGMGNIIEVEVIGGELDKHTIRYMHMGAVHPSLKMGDVLEPGQEIGLMGGTGVQRSSPHLHLDISTPDGKRVDPAPYLKGLQGRPDAHCALPPAVAPLLRWAALSGTSP